MMANRIFVTLVGLAVVAVAGGCVPAATNEVVVYAALDREFSEPILTEFGELNGISVLPKYDIESTKTVGLVTALIQERNRPRCDVFWNNEILHTLRLQKLGLLDAYFPASADRFPPNYRSGDGQWYGFAARARVLIVNTDLVPAGERPKSVQDLVDPRWHNRCGLAKPLFGTTATHMAVLYSMWGAGRARNFLASLHENAQVLSGNKQVAVAVGQGQLAFGLTDTDDAIIEKERGKPVEIVYPDQGEGEPGTLFIPNTLCILKGAPHRKNAGRLLDFLLSADVEMQLARGESAQFPLHADASQQPRIFQPGIRWMDVDFAAAADSWDQAAEFLKATFAAAD